MEYFTIEELSKLWGLSQRRIQTLCAQGKIIGALRFGRDWMVPKNAQKPVDGRTKAGRQCSDPQTVMPLPRKTPFLYMSDLYSQPGSARASIASLAYHHEAQLLLEAEIAYSRGQIDDVYRHANYLLNRQSGFYAMISAGMLLAFCAIWKGDLAMWRRAKVHIAEAPVQDDLDRDVVLLSITAVDSMLYDTSSFPEWFKIGCFEPLHKDTLPAAKVFYAKYLYAAGYGVATKQFELKGVQGLALLNMIPNTVEPMIAQAIADQSIVAEMYLRMTCATVYHTVGNDAQAIRHIDRAIQLALPDQLYGFLAEYCRVLGALLEERICLADPKVWIRVNALYKIYNKGWSHLSGSVRGRTIITTLSNREREVAKLAAFGMQNAEIGKKLHMSLSGVKQAVRVISEKTGVGRDQFAAFL